MVKFTILLVAALATLLTRVDAGKLDSCSLQEKCIDWSVTEETNALCSATSAACEYKICFTLNWDRPGCTKDDELSHTCHKDEDKCLEATGFNVDANVTEDLNNGWTECQIVKPGDTAQFLLKDGNVCQSGLEEFTLDGNSGVTTACEPRPADIPSCTGNDPGMECVWTVTAPTDCPTHGGSDTGNDQAPVTTPLASTEDGASCQSDDDCSCHSMADAHAELEALLPQEVKFDLLSGERDGSTDASYFDVEFIGTSRLNGLKFDSYCIDVGHGISPGKVYEGQGHYFTDTDLWDTNIDRPEYLQELAWVLNSYEPGETYSDEDLGLYTMTSGTVQRTIWYIIDISQHDSTIGEYDDDWAKHMYAEAMVKGKDYMPGCDDIVPIVIVPSDNSQQHLIAETNFSALGIACDSSCANEICSPRSCTDGQCVTASAPDHTTCGPEPEEDCALGLVCMAGECVDGGVSPSGTPCGPDDQAIDECNLANTCDGLSTVCQLNHVDDGTFCGTEPENDCYQHDYCSMGMCTSGGKKPANSLCDLGMGCSTDYCDGEGTCLPGCGAAASDAICEATLSFSEGKEDKCNYAGNNNPIKVISSTGVDGQVTVTIDQVWEAQNEETGLEWLAVQRSLDGDTVCSNFNNVKTQIEFKADCDQAGHGALVMVFLQDKKFSGGSKVENADFSQCNPPDVDKKEKCYFFLEVPCDCTVNNQTNTQPNEPECKGDNDCDALTDTCDDLMDAHTALKALLPTPVSLTLTTDAGLHSDASFYDATVDGQGALKGKLDGWCIDAEHTIPTEEYAGVAYYFNDPHLADTNIDKPSTIDEVAWLLNHYYPGITYQKDLNGDGEITPDETHVMTSGTLQRALWYIIDDRQATANLGTFHDEWAKYLAHDAVEKGEGFVPGCYDKIPIIIVPNDGNSKHLLLEATFDDVGINCDSSCPIPSCNVNKCVDGACVVVTANEGMVCGSEGGICQFPDTCQQGQCVPGGYEPVGYMCGDTTSNECDAADTCNGFGVCLDNFADSDTPCGEQPANQCMYAGMCNGEGGCNAGELPKPEGEECDLGNDNTKDQCDGQGTCQAVTTCTYNAECLPEKQENKKCPETDVLLFKLEAGTTDLNECKQACADDEGCAFYAWGNSGTDNQGMCMGCTSSTEPEPHEGFDFYPIYPVGLGCVFHECNEGFCETRVEDDGKACGTGETNTCQPSQCQAGVCVMETYQDGTPCGDPGDDCNSPDVCKSGMCESGAPIVVDTDDSSLPKACKSTCKSIAKAHEMFESILPQPLTFTIEPDAGTDPDASYIDAELVGDPPLAGPTRIDGWSIAVDVPEEHKWTSGQTFEGEAFHYNDKRLWNSTVSDANMLQEAAWIINNYVPGTILEADLTDDGVDETEQYVLSTGTLQRAIWYLFTEDPGSHGLGQYRDDWALFIKDQAIARGQDYVPGCDAIIPVVLIPKNSEHEHFILETSFQALGVQCNDQCPDEECNEYQCAVGDDGRGVCQAAPKADGTECGSAGDSGCILHDECQAGKCVTDVFAPSGTSCGSDEENECNHADTCDDKGHCLTNIEPDETPCGEGETVCKLAGSCSAGNCAYAKRDNGTPCGDEEGDCVNADYCYDGECADAGFKDEGATCGSQNSTACDLPDTCDGQGNCQSNVLPDEDVCPGAPEPVNDCWTYETCSGGQCIPSFPKAKGESCDTGFNCSLDVCDGEGRCLLGCATGLGAASDGASCVDDFVCASATPDGCSRSFCNDNGICETIKEPDMTDCGDPGDGCTFSKCQAGVCTEQPPLDDGSACEIQCNSALKAQEAMKAMLPMDITFRLRLDEGQDSEASYFDATFKGNSTLREKRLDAWCIDAEHSIRMQRDYVGKAYHFTDPFEDGANIDDLAALDEAAWLLNNYFPGKTYTADLTNDGVENPTSYVMTSGTIQRAVWHLVDDTRISRGLGKYRDDWAQFMAKQAAAFGNGFVPGCSDTIPMVAIVNGGMNGGMSKRQNLFIEATYAQLGIPCDGSCTDEQCNTFACAAGVCEVVPHDDGTECGKTGSECVIRDTCQAGQCVPGVAVAAASDCGSPDTSECDAADTCDGQGLCVPNHVDDETPCGDTPNECQLQGTCQAGTCTGLMNKPSGSTCGSPGDICVDPDHCEAGVCVAGENSPKGKLCGDQYSDECNKADVCDGQGQCDANLMPDGKECGEMQPNQCIGPNQCQAGICVDGVNKTVGEPCDFGINCDRDFCDGGGVCKLGCAVDIGAASDNGVTKPATTSNPTTLAPETPAPTAPATSQTPEDIGAASDNGVTTPVPTVPTTTQPPEEDTEGCTTDEECSPETPDECMMYTCTDGSCVSMPKPANTLCGSAPVDACDMQDTCDGEGNCIDHKHSEGYECGEQVSCHYPTTCQSGECVPGAKMEICSSENPPVTDDNPDKKKEGSGGSYGDPHLKTWKGELYDFHGACDLVLVKDAAFSKGLGLEIHIRTTIRRDWSFISAAAVRIGTDILEVRSGAEYYLNGIKGADLPSKVGNYPLTMKAHGQKRHRFKIGLKNRREVLIKVYNEFLAVSVNNANEEDFAASEGMMGSFKTGELIARDGETVVDDTNLFGFEWQVQQDDPILFVEPSGPQYPQPCDMPKAKTSRHRRLSEDGMVSLEEAEKACQSWPVEGRESCIYDILSTGDLGMAEAGAF